MLSKIAKHTAIYAAGDLLSKSIAFLLIPLYTHYLQPAEYGTLELLELSSYVVGFFIAMGIAQALTRYFHDQESDDAREVLVSTSRQLVIGICLCTLPVLLLLSGQISVLVFQNDQFANSFRLVFTTLLIQTIGEVANTLLRIQERSVTFVTISLCRVAVSLSLNVYFVSVLQLGIRGILWSGLAAAIVSTSLLFYATRSFRNRPFSKIYAKQLIGYGLPLIASWGGMFILNFSDRFCLQRLSSLEEVGVYSLAYKFGFIPNMLIISPFMMYWSVKRFEVARDETAPALFSSVFTYMIAASLLVSTGIALLAPEIFRVIAEESYRRGSAFVAPILLAYVFYAGYVYQQFGLLQSGKTHLLGVVALSAGAVNILLNILLIPSFGGEGAALATVSSFALLLAITHRLSQKYYPITYEYGRIGKLLLAMWLVTVLGASLPTMPLWWSVAAKLAIYAVAVPGALLLLGFLNEKELSSLKGLRAAFRPQ